MFLFFWIMTANAILSILRKPAAQEDVKPMAEDPLHFHVSDDHSDLKSHVHAGEFDINSVDVSNGRTVNHNCNTNTKKSEAVEISAAGKSVVYEAGEDSPENLLGLYTRYQI